MSAISCLVRGNRPQRCLCIAGVPEDQPVPRMRQLEPILSVPSEGHMMTNVVMELHEDGSASGHGYRA
jgi:hypothetical protein